jgi:hypothetical protein
MASTRHVPLDFAGVINLWPTIGEFCAATGVPDATARAWRTRGNIPAEHWDTLVAAAGRSGIRGVSVDSLMGALRIAKAREAAERRGAPLRGRKTAQAAAKDVNRAPTQNG